MENSFPKIIDVQGYVVVTKDGLVGVVDDMHNIRFSDRTCVSVYFYNDRGVCQVNSIYSIKRIYMYTDDELRKICEIIK